MNYNNLKVIVYERKSTDREDMQQASLPAQSKNNKQTTSLNKLKILKTITEKASAKNHWTREWFNEMIALIEAGKAQGIVVDEPTRISRSTLDAAIIVHLMETGKIKYVFTNSMRFAWDSIMEVKLLEDMMQWAKVDNKMKAKSTKDKMLFIAENSHKLLIKAPFGYQNFREWKSPTDVRPHPENYLIWKEMLRLLGEWIPYKDVAKILYKTHGLTTRNNTPVTAEQIRRWLFHKFHDGLYDFAGRTFKHNHKLVVSSKYVHEIRARREHKTFQKTSQEKFPLKWILKAYWGDKMTLTAYKKKANIYYNSIPRYSDNGKNINVNQEIIFKSFEKTLNSYVIQDKELKSKVITLMKDHFSEIQEDAENNAQRLKAKLTVIQNKQSNLLNLLCDEKIKQRDFDTQRQVYLDKEIEIQSLLDWIFYISEDNLASAYKCIELLDNLLLAWKNGGIDKKAEIMKMICIELYIDTKKQLYVQENELFELIKVLNFSNGVTLTVQSWSRKLIEFVIYQNKYFLELLEKVEKVLT